MPSGLALPHIGGFCHMQAWSQHDPECVSKSIITQHLLLWTLHNHKIRPDKVS
jgi:hypothetical protein